MPYFSKATPLRKIYITLKLFSQIMVKTRRQVISENQKDFCTEKLPYEVNILRCHNLHE